MKIHIKNIFSFTIIAMGLLLLDGCRDDYNHTLDESKANFTKNDQPASTEVDIWLYENYVKPFNIEVKYRWEAGELPLNKVLVPPYASQVRPLMDAIKQTWVDPYVSEAGDPFFKKFAPKQFVLVGSPNFNPNGSITLGTADAGRKIVLYNINSFKKNDRKELIGQLHAIHHEFGHILHQNIAYPVDYKTITAGSYTALWTSVPLTQALSKGFISSYAMASPDEDFVEMIAFMLTEGKRGFDRIVCSLPQDAQAILRRKQQIVINYFSSVYKIDFAALQTKVSDAIDILAPRNLINDLGDGLGLTFTSVQFSSDLEAVWPTGFQSIYEDTKNGLAAVGGANRVLDYISLYFGANGYLILQVAYHRGTGNTVSVAYYFSIESFPNGTATFTRVGGDANSQAVESGVTSILNYFSGHTFTFDYLPYDDGDCVYDFGAFLPVGEPAINSFGFLTIE